MTLLLRWLLGIIGLGGIPGSGSGSGGGGGGGTSGGCTGGPGTYTMPPGLSWSQKRAYAALMACAPCSQSGSGSGGGTTRPCGCSTCSCCPSICWWKTTWHKSWTATTGKYATGLASPEWTMTSYSMSLVDVSADYYWGGELASVPGSCSIGMGSKLNSDCTLGTAPAVLTGTVSYLRTIAPFDTVTFNVTLYPTITIQFGCPDATGYVLCQYTGFTSDGGFTGTSIPTSTGNGFLDFAVANDSGTDELGIDFSTCSFTASSPTTIGLPAISIQGVA